MSASIGADSHSRALVRVFRILTCALAVGVLAGPATTAAGAAQTAYSGQATVIRANVLGIETTLSDTGPLATGGGAQDTSLLSTSVPGLLSANVLHASVVGQGNHTRSEASVAELDLTAGGNDISADFLMARAEATCSGGRSSASGNAEVVGLVVNGERTTVAGTPNETIALPGGGKIVVNEQSSSGGTFTVNALHVVVPGVADVVVSSASAGIQCPPPAQCDRSRDFVTSGGWIVAPSGRRANFGAAGGIKNGGFWGHLVYIDHGAGLRVKGTAVTAYSLVDAVTRHIEGTAEINGVPGTYSLDLSDRGEPGREDTFSLRLSNGYSATGTLAGGNVQLHLACK